MRGSSRLRPFAGAAVTNIAMTVLSATAGLMIARAVGPLERGDYAAVTAWFGVFLIIGEVGQTAATTYFSSRWPERAPTVLATSRTLMTMTGVVATAVGLLLAPRLAHHAHDVTVGYLVVFASCLPSFVGASYTFTLQARSLNDWLIARIAQPLTYFASIAVAWVTGHLTLVFACAALAATVTLQTVIAYVLCRRHGLHRGRFDKELVSPLLRYGASQAASQSPTIVNARLDQIVLAQMSRTTDLGHYAVAVSLTSLASPVVASIGNVLFPRLAGSNDAAERLRHERSAIAASGLLAAAICGVIAASATWAVPFLFGSQYHAAVKMVWLLAPGGAFLAIGLTASDLLRARGMPGTVALSQGLAMIATVVLLWLLLPPYGAVGAAVTSSVAYAVALVVMLVGLRHGSDAQSAHRSA